MNAISQIRSAASRGVWAASVCATTIGLLGSINTAHAAHAADRDGAMLNHVRAQATAQSAKADVPGLPHGALPHATANDSAADATGRWLRIQLPEPQGLDQLTQPTEDSPT